MIINRLLLIGTSVKNAEIKFNNGINIISGASDTGKTYIYQCINYVLGSNRKPKDIIEARKYNNFVLEVTINDNIFTLVRDKDSNNVQLYKNCFELIDKNEVINLKIGTKEKDKENINEWLIKKILGSEVKILMKKSKTRNLTFRDLMHFCCSSEDKIISETSPFFTEEYVNKTLYKSIFKYLISGEDDSNIRSIEEKRIKVNKDVLLSILDNQIFEVKQEIQRLKGTINNKRKGNDDLGKLNQKIDALGKDINTLNMTIAENMSQLDNLNMNRLELISKKDSFTKLGLKLELDKTISEINIKINNLESKILKVKKGIEKDKIIIEEKNKLLMDENNKFLLFKEIQLNKVKLEFLNENLKKLLNKKEEIKQIKVDTKNSHEILQIKNMDKYLDILKQTIDIWTKKNNRIKFDYSNNDIIINGKKRSECGKGYRAFYSTAMIIALQRFNEITFAPKPGFVMIDSPLVSLKEQKVTKNNELIDDYMQINMIEDLINKKDLGQVIFFENKEFPKFSDKLNYIYYSESGTNGFIGV